MSSLAGSLSDKALSSIFIYASLPNSKGREQFRRYPFLLGHVCSRWRRVCFATPDIWTRIAIKCSHEFTQFDLTPAQTYLSYAGPTLPLLLRVNGCDDGSELRDDRDSFDHLVAEHATRWTDVRFFVFLQTDVVNAIRGLTSLKKLMITFPKIQAKEVQNTSWSQSLELYREPEPITLPSLTDLSLDFRRCKSPSSAMVPVLELLTLPSLSLLAFMLSKDCGCRGPAWRLLGKMLARSEDPPLKTFHTSYDSHPSDRLEMADFLQHIPYLKRADSLRFDFPLWDLLDKRDPDSGEFMYAPSLKVARFSYLDFLYDYRMFELKLVLEERAVDGEGITHLITDQETFSIRRFEKSLDPLNFGKDIESRRSTIIWRGDRAVVVPWDIYD